MTTKLSNKIIDCLDLAKKSQEHLEGFISKNKLKPVFATILVGDNLDSKVYVEIKNKRAKELGIENKLYYLSSSTKQNELEKLII